MEKTDLRTHHLKLRHNMTDSERAKKSEEIIKKLKSLPCYKNAKNIMVYLSAKGEVKTESFIKQALSDGKKLASPVCRESFLMDGVIFSDFSDLILGKYNILAPKGEETMPACDIDLLIVPGSVFGRNKHRIGYGKGYYDRFIEKTNNRCIKVGICFSDNLIDAVPYSEFDKTLDVIITENEIIM